MASCTAVPEFYTSSCKCGEVSFELEGKPAFGPKCCCNDCIASLYYVDGKAKEAGVENISNAQSGNYQSVVNAVWRKSAIKCIKGADKIVYYKLRPKSTTLLTYTSCCYTPVICAAGRGFGGLLYTSFPFNRNTISPTFPAENLTFRGNTEDAVKPELLPKDGMKAYSPGPPFWVLMRVIKMKMTGGKPSDTKTWDEVLNREYEGITEVAGIAPYEAGGFKNVKM